jgi:O-methyltransferase involved in polyketide biosynthesis
LYDAEPSRTALGAAAYRAAHQLLDKPPIFADPLAIPILGEDGAVALQRQLEPEQAQSWRRRRAFIAARSAFTEEALAEAAENGG